MDSYKKINPSFLFEAIVNKNYKKMDSLIAAGVNPDLTNDSGETPLIFAVQHKDLIAIEILLKAGANIEILDDTKQSAFVHAINMGIPEFVEVFVKENPTLIQKKNQSGHYPFVYCAYVGQAHLIPILFPKTLNLNLNLPEKTHKGFSVFAHLALMGPESVISDLVKFGAIVDFKDTMTQQVFFEFIMRKEHDKVVSFLKASIVYAGKDGFAEGLNLLTNWLNNHDLFLKYYLNDILEICAKHDYLGRMIMFMEHFKQKLSADIIPHLFYIASKNGKSRIVEHLIDNYDDCFSQDDIDNCYEIAASNHHSVVVFLLTQKYEDTISQESKYKALIKAITSHDISCLMILLEDGEVKELIQNRAHQIFVTIEKLMISQPENYQPIYDILMQNPEFDFVSIKFRNRMQDQFNTFVPNNIVAGPANKDFYTEELKWIIKYTLRHPMQAVFSIEENNMYVSIKNQKINLSKLLELSELTHLFLTEEDSAYFFRFKKLDEEELTNIQRPLPIGYILNGYTLTRAEQFSIYDYSNHGYEKINDTIYKMPNKELDSSEEIRLNFFLTLFLASGLNKINPKWIRNPEDNDSKMKTYRGERNITSFELNQRILGLNNSANGIIQKNLGFASTSVHLNIANCFAKGLSRIEFDDCYGKDIQPIALLPKEGEYLQLPCHFHFTEVRQQEALPVFKARTVTPLYNKQRSINQELSFETLVNLTQSHFLLGADLFNKKKSPELGDMLDICQYVYDYFLSKPFTDTSIELDWNLETLFGVINRPNHGLPHVMRVAYLISTVAVFLMHCNINTNFVFKFSDREISITTLMAIFSIVGRKNEAGFKQMKLNTNGYRIFKQNSAQAFSDYVRKNQFLNMTEEEIELYSGYILKMGEPGENAPAAILLALAHKLDLLRCYESERVENDIIKPLNQFLPPSYTEQLLNYAERLLHATGNRVFYGENPCDYDHDLFYHASTNVKFCYELISQINVPNLEEASSFDIRSKCKP